MIDLAERRSPWFPPRMAPLERWQVRPTAWISMPVADHPPEVVGVQAGHRNARRMLEFRTSMLVTTGFRVSYASIGPPRRWRGFPAVARFSPAVARFSPCSRRWPRAPQPRRTPVRTTRPRQGVSQELTGVRQVAYSLRVDVISEVGAVCGSAARTDLCGGRSAVAVPTATPCSRGLEMIILNEIAGFVF